MATATIGGRYVKKVVEEQLWQDEVTLRLTKAEAHHLVSVLGRVQPEAFLDSAVESQPLNRDIYNALRQAKTMMMTNDKTHRDEWKPFTFHMLVSSSKLYKKV